MVRQLSDGNTRLEIVEKLNKDHTAIRKKWDILNWEYWQDKKKVGLGMSQKQTLEKAKDRVINEESGLTSKLLL